MESDCRYLLDRNVSNNQKKRTIMSTPINPNLDLYGILSIFGDNRRTVKRSSIVSAYRKRARIYHPDRNPGEYAHSNFVKLNHAREILENEVSRLEYDVSIGLRGIEEDVIIIDDYGDTQSCIIRYDLRRKIWELVNVF